MNALLDSYEGKAEKFRSLVTTQHSLVRKNKLLLSLFLLSFLSPFSLPLSYLLLLPFFLPSSPLFSLLGLSCQHSYTGAVSGVLCAAAM